MPGKGGASYAKAKTAKYVQTKCLKYCTISMVLEAR